MIPDPDLKEDKKNLSLITGSAVVTVLLTAGLLAAASVTRESPEVHYEIAVEPVVEAVVEPVVEVVVEPKVEVTPVSGSNRLFGRVVTRSGKEYTGFIRWDRNEGSWADLLDATKVNPHGAGTQSGIRFGHVQSIERLNSHSALFVLKTGEEVEMEARATDLGSGLRALVIDDPTSMSVELDWHSFDHIEFFSAPEDVRANEERMFGTLTTRSGESFTGYVTWDIDEIYSTDVLDGEEHGFDHEIPFGDIEVIERASSSAARVLLHSGEEYVLRGTNDVDDSNSGITVSDIGLGQVKLEWDDFEKVRFHDADFEPGYALFDGGQRLIGTVVTESGREYSGEIAWDNDESFGWEMLNGYVDDLELQVEFNNIARISKVRWGAVVELNDGRIMELSDSNDVDSGNRGITIRNADGVREVDWEDFAEVIFNR